MDKIENFFNKRKMDVKFAGAGKGQALGSQGASAAPKPKAQAPSASRVDPGKDAQRAGQAALDRFNNKQNPPAKPKPKTSLAPEPAAPTTTTTSSSPSPAPNMDEVEQLSGVDAVMYLRYVSGGVENYQTCEDTMKIYFQNILANPTEAKYQRIRASNPNFQQRVGCISETSVVFKAVGFTINEETNTEGQTEKFWIFTPNEQNVEQLQLATAAFADPETNFNRQVFVVPSGSTANTVKTDDAFFKLSSDELLAEQRARQHQNDLDKTLRTREMRERDALRHFKKYYTAKIRIRFPDSTMIQGKFFVAETLQDVREFVLECLESPDVEFSLYTMEGPLQDDSATLRSLGMVPTGLITIRGAVAINKELLALSQS